MSFRIRFVCGGLQVAAVFVCLFSSTATEVANCQHIAQALQKYVDDGEIAGAVALVGQNDKLEIVTVGLADLESKRPMARNTVFRIMSMTKPITATALMILVDEGRVSLDDPVEKYVPGFASAKTKAGEPVRGLTIRHLLTHTSGLVGEQKCEESLAATAENLAARPFGFQPGTKWEYGPSLNVVGRIIEVAAGQPYEEFVEERIFQPLAMSDTAFFPRESQRERLATVYEPGSEEKSLAPSKELVIEPLREKVPNPSGGLVSTATDLHRFYKMVLAGGELDGVRIVSPNSVKAMTTVQSGDLTTGFTPGNGWGFGWCVVRKPEGVTGMLSPGTFGHGGKYGTQGWVDPERQAIFVLLYQREKLRNSDGSKIRGDFQQAAVESLEK